jgi:hypothetical protein
MALPKPPVPTYDLIIPSSKKKIQFRPFLVKEEKVLLIAMESQDANQIKNAVVQILKSCILTKSIKLESLAMFDIEYIFMNIRAKSVSEMVEMKFTCTDDNETQVDYTMNLEDVKVQFLEGHDNKIMLDETRGMIMKYPGYDQFVKTQIMQKEPSTEEVFDIIIDSVDQIIDGEDVYDSSTSSRKEIAEYIESLTTKQFEKIREFFATMPKLAHTIKIINPNTGVECTYEIEGLVNFFA